MFWHLEDAAPFKRTLYKLEMVHVCTWIPVTGKGELQFSQQLEDSKSVPLTTIPFLGIPISNKHRPKEYESVPLGLYAFVSHSEYSLAFDFFSFFFCNNRLAEHPSVDWVCEARCACTHLFTPFIWNQIVLLMLIGVSCWPQTELVISHIHRTKSWGWISWQQSF